MIFLTALELLGYKKAFEFWVLGIKLKSEHFKLLTNCKDSEDIQGTRVRLEYNS